MAGTAPLKAFMLKAEQAERRVVGVTTVVLMHTAWGEEQVTMVVGVHTWVNTGHMVHPEYVHRVFWHTVVPVCTWAHLGGPAVVVHRGLPVGTVHFGGPCVVTLTTRLPLPTTTSSTSGCSITSRSLVRHTPSTTLEFCTQVLFSRRT